MEEETKTKDTKKVRSDKGKGRRGKWLDGLTVWRKSKNQTAKSKNTN
ncbi:MAG: hypothetical protein ACYS30_14625 [Planctomycetota bacterium]|jgi:hypothetical protein